MKSLFFLLTVTAIGFSSCSSCQRAREIAERREALANADAEKLEDARAVLHWADSVKSFLEFDVQAMKDTLVVLEKNEKYQDKGFYVLKKHAGDKSGLKFFVEVEEEGKVLLVKIDENRKWTFSEVELTKVPAREFLSGELVRHFIGRDLTDEELADAEQILGFADKMNRLRDAEAAIKKNKMKIEFYEKKISKKSSSID
ncbi:MAG: hypothetical protein J5663_10110 [Bacteroidaceae bacterium]|nr:hypothetical protein [Bacteroidaceae bacterium]